MSLLRSLSSRICKARLSYRCYAIVYVLRASQILRLDRWDVWDVRGWFACLWGGSDGSSKGEGSAQYCNMTMSILPLVLDAANMWWNMAVFCFHNPSKTWPGYIPSVTLGPARLGFGTRLGRWACVPATSLQVSSPMLGGGFFMQRESEWNVCILMRSYAYCMELECFTYEDFSRARTCSHKSKAVCKIFNSCIETELSNLMSAQILVVPHLSLIRVLLWSCSLISSARMLPTLGLYFDWTSSWLGCPIYGTLREEYGRWKCLYMCCTSNCFWDIFGSRRRNTFGRGKLFHVHLL